MLLAKSPLADTRWYMSPAIVYSVVWLLVIFLYSLHLSALLVFDVDSVLYVCFIALGPFLVAYFFTRSLASKFRARSNLHANQIRFVKRRNRYLFATFVGIILVQMLYEGYVPLVSLIVDGAGSVSQFEFGIASIHGLALAIGALCATIEFYVYLKQKSKGSLFIISSILILFALVVTRKMIVVTVIQMFFVFLITGHRLRPITIFYVCFFFAISVIVFGVIGDVRTGRELFISLCRPTFIYPEWMPTGPMWVYIYMVTPVLNLVSFIDLSLPVTGDFQFACGLIPGVLRDVFGCSRGIGFDNEYQISGAFNVATGYIGLHESWGNFGIILFSVFHGSISALSSTRPNNSLKGVLIYGIVMQITLLMLFGNGLLNLNVAGQFLVMFLVFLRFKSYR